MSNKKKKILILPGDGIGPEVSSIAKELLILLDKKHSLGFDICEGLIGGDAYEKTGPAFISLKSDPLLNRSITS
mgnify:CR=1 FL=1